MVWATFVCVSIMGTVKVIFPSVSVVLVVVSFLLRFCVLLSLLGEVLSMDLRPLIFVAVVLVALWAIWDLYRVSPESSEDNCVTPVSVVWYGFDGLSLLNDTCGGRIFA